MAMLSAVLTALCAAPSPVANVNITMYSGRWYQTFGSLAVQTLMEAGGHCVTADYGPVAGRADVVKVRNTCSVFGHNGGVTGYAIANPDGSGTLDVHLGPSANPTSAGEYKSTNYIIFGLGPVVDGRYDYTLITDPTGFGLFVLTRNVTRFASRYESAVLDILKEKGFTGFLNRPRRTQQDEKCKYSPPG